MRETARSTDILARLGGDEFAIVLPGIAGENALEIISRSVATLDEPFSIAGGPVIARGAFGLATSAGAGVSDLDSLLSRADTAMYRAKRQHLGPTFFDAGVDGSPQTCAVVTSASASSVPQLASRA